MGIEPTLSAWKAEVLPLNYTRKTGGVIGIRTLDTSFSSYTRLAIERIRPTRPSLHVHGGERGIRTLETGLAPTRFPIVLLRPDSDISPK
jgi:hypothetical protein